MREQCVPVKYLDAFAPDHARPGVFYFRYLIISITLEFLLLLLMLLMVIKMPLSIGLIQILNRGFVNFSIMPVLFSQIIL